MKGLSGFLYRSAKYFILTVLILNALALVIFADGLVFGALDQLIAKEPAALQDFIKYYACGKIALSNSRSQAYEPAIQFAQLQELMNTLHHSTLAQQYFVPTDYPPPIYPIMAVLALMPISQALGVWWFISAFSTLSSIYLLRNRRLVDTLLVLLWTASSIIAWRTTGMGQTTWIILGTMSLFFYYFLAKRDVACGAMLALSMLKIQYAPFLLVPVIMAKRWRTIAVTSILILILVGAASILMGPQIITTYPSVVSRIEAYDPYIPTMVCFKALCSWFVPAFTLSILTICGMLAGILSCIFIWKYAKGKSDIVQRWAIALTICIALLTSQHTQNYDLLLLTIAAAVTVPALTVRGNIFIKNSMPSNLWSALLIAFPIISWLLTNIGWSLTRIRMHPYFVQSVGFFIFLLVLSVTALYNYRRVIKDSNSK